MPALVSNARLDQSPVDRVGAKPAHDSAVGFRSGPGLPKGTYVLSLREAKPGLPAGIQRRRPAGRPSAFGFRAIAAMLLVVCGGALCAMIWADGRSTSAADASSVAPQSAWMAARAQGWLTTPDRTRFAARVDGNEIAAGLTRAGVDIQIDATRGYQRIVGFGAALTASSAHLLAELSPRQRATALQTLFGRHGGAGISVVRVVMGASDFSPSPYTYDELPSGRTDPGLAHFSIRYDETAIVPILRQALAINPRLVILAAPWTAPAWMKSSDSLNGGTLVRRYYRTYAHYFVRFIAAYAAAGVPVSAISVQNEPEHVAKDYPTMVLTAGQEATFVGDYLGPALAHAGLARVRIIGYDQNWADTAFPITLLHSRASRYLYGTAFHCYQGDPDSQATVHDASPRKAIWFTECSGGAWAPNFGAELRWNTSKLLIGALRNWAQTIVYWNVALAPGGGPHVGGCSDCRGVLTIGARGALTENVEFAELRQLSSVVRPGARRVASTASLGGIETIAFVNPDGSRGIIINNTRRENRIVNVTTAPHRAISTTIPGGSTLSLRLLEPNGCAAASAASRRNCS